LNGAIRTSDLLAGVSTSSSAVALRDGVERLQKLLLIAQVIAIASEAMMSEGRRQGQIGF
jgi:hypothetical protein